MKNIKEFIKEHKEKMPVYFSYPTYKKLTVKEEEPEVSSTFYQTKEYYDRKFHKYLSQIIIDENTRNTK